MPEQIVNKDFELFLKEIEILNLKHGKFLDYTHSDFNIFTIIRKGSEEVGLHSAFISELLNPEGSHKIGGVFLELFLNINPTIKKANIELNIKKTTVETEKWIGEIDKKNDWNKGGAIDIFITDKKHTIAIENKIFASDQYKQLHRYNNFLKDKSKKSFLFYLTLDGHSPSADSISNLKKRKDFHNISYKVDILNWLKLCKEKVCDIPRISEPIQQYIDLVKELTGQSLNDEYIMAINNFIIKDSKNLKLAKDIAEAFTYAKTEIQLQFWDSLEKSIKEMLEKKTIEIKQDYTKGTIHKYYSGRNNTWHGINLNKLDDEHKLYLRIEIEEKIYFGFKIYEDDRYDADDKEINKLSEKIHNIFPDLSERNEHWLGNQFFNTSIVKDFNFRTFYPDEIFDLADKTERKKLTDNMAEEIKNIIDEFNERYK